jgi:hypothetical protein
MTHGACSESLHAPDKTWPKTWIRDILSFKQGTCCRLSRHFLTHDDTACIDSGNDSRGRHLYFQRWELLAEVVSFLELLCERRHLLVRHQQRAPHCVYTSGVCAFRSCKQLQLHVHSDKQHMNTCMQFAQPVLRANVSCPTHHVAQEDTPRPLRAKDAHTR